MFIDYITTPIGMLQIQANTQSILSVQFVDSITPLAPNSITDMCVWQLQAYFLGSVAPFSVPLHNYGTPFQQKVWRACTQVPYAAVSTYKSIAYGLEKPRAAIAVGQALARNPFLIIIPCHRVLNAKFQNTGYAGGMQRKDFLLQFEQKINGF
jgi:methylated-DNA-[protein]-cysteine S-methyltransferase